MAQVVKRVRSPVDFLSMSPLDLHTVVNKMSSRHVALVTWLMPTQLIECTGVHRRYEVESFFSSPLVKDPEAASEVPEPPRDEGKEMAFTKKRYIEFLSRTATAMSSRDMPVEETLASRFGKDKDKMDLGFVTMTVGVNYPGKTSWLEQRLDAGPHPSVALRISVMDKILWQRTQWCVESICKALFWGKIPHSIYGVNLDYKSPVSVNAEFNEEKGIYSKYEASVPDRGIEIELEDTGVSLLDPATPTVPGFYENESALRQLGLLREVNMGGVGGCVYRQTLWSTPTVPNVARIIKCDVDKYFTDLFGCPPVGDPLHAWIFDYIPETNIYQMEAQVEVENEPSTATHFNERSVVERVQKKAMNRYFGFKDNVRSKVYGENTGDSVH